MTGMRHFRNPGRTTLLVLGMLFLRALVPAGFMLAPVDGGLTVVVCDVEMSAGERQHHHHPGHDGAAHPDGAHSDPTCPYAQSAGPAPLPTLPAIAGGAVSDLQEQPAAVAQIISTCGPIRQQSPRGPPSLA
jgi:Protein of unknown function (DUF2946)